MEVHVARTMTSRQFNQDTAGAKRAAADGPVVVTDRNRPAHVLMTWEHYRLLSGDAPTPMDLIADRPAQDVDLPLPERTLPRDSGLDW
jgi:prevent-host-death family protein